MADIRILPDHGEIEPASFAQIRKAKDGKYYEIEDDVANVVRDIKRIDNRLCVRFSEAGNYFVVYMREAWQEPGDGYLVTTAQELDQRLVKRIEKVAHESYNFAEEVDRVDTEYEREHEHRQREQIGEIAERLSHALRKDRGFTTNRAFIPKEITDGNDA